MEALQHIDEVQQDDRTPPDEAGQRPARILVVDDESDLEILFRQMFRREIRRQEMTFDFVNNGQEALEKLEADADFDMVLSDIRMPKMDGLTLLANLNKRYPLLKAVMVTAYGDMENIRRAMNSGAFDFISKPIQYLDLKATIEKTLGHVAELRELHRAKREKEKAQERLVFELRKLDRLKDEFLANTSHELRTPLNGIIGIVESLTDGVAGPVGHEMGRNLELVLQSSRRLAYLVNDILDFAKLKNESFGLKPRPLDLRKIIDASLILSKPLAQNKQVELINDIPADAPTVLADEDRLQQIALNLIGNAVKFTERGMVRVAAERRGERLEIQVIDTGVGIPADKLDMIFEAFQQGEGSTSRRHGGTGLGLSITKKLVELHGGDIKAASEHGKGSTFRFDLPVTERDPENEITAVLPAPPPDPQSEIYAEDDDAPVMADENASHYRILAVDDNPTNLNVLANQLKAYRLTTAKDGREALHLLSLDEQNFDLVLLDVMMPGMTGYEVCRSIRQNYGPNELPILLLTARSQVADLVAGLESGANDYVTKPFSMRELRARVRTHLLLAEATREMKEAQASALVNARAAGKADFATTVIHNLGNILTSVKVSCAKIAGKLVQSKLAGFVLAGQMLEERQDHLLDFFTKDPKGRKLPDYFMKLPPILKKENDSIEQEVETIKKRIVLMERAIEIQQGDAKDEMTALLVEDLIEESLTVLAESLNKYRIELHKRFQLNQPTPLQRTQLIHTLVNLIKNSIEAMHNSPVRKLTIETGVREDGAPFCRIADTGEGVKDLSMLFVRGATTKADGHGFGLHGCLSAMRAMGGNLEGESEGEGRGAAFTLTFAKPADFELEIDSRRRFG